MGLKQVAGILQTLCPQAFLKTELLSKTFRIFDAFRSSKLIFFLIVFSPYSHGSHLKWMNPAPLQTFEQFTPQGISRLAELIYTTSIS